MDFIEGLPKSESKEVIMVVVDRFSKYGHFIALSHPFTAKEVASTFFDHVYKLHGLPQSIVSDRDKIFLSSFWQELFKKLGVKLNMSTAYHPQTDGQSERLNRCLETYLRCATSQQPKHWSKWLSLAEFWYNTNYHTALKMSPFQALYGYAPPTFTTDQSVKITEGNVVEWMETRKLMLAVLKENLLRAQNRMKQYADKKRSDREFSIGDWVYLKLQPYRQITAAVRRNVKLSSKYYGPYLVLEKLGPVAYRLELPSGCLIHPVFHVSQLKRKVGRHHSAQIQPPLSGPDGQLLTEPIAILKRRMVKKNNAVSVEVLVQWANLSPEEATWEEYTHLKAQFPDFNP